jgi:hypothetical protein
MSAMRNDLMSRSEHPSPPLSPPPGPVARLDSNYRERAVNNYRL